MWQESMNTVFSLKSDKNVSCAHDFYRKILTEISFKNKIAKSERKLLKKIGIYGYTIFIPMKQYFDCFDFEKKKIVLSGNLQIQFKYVFLHRCNLGVKKEERQLSKKHYITPTFYRKDKDIILSLPV